MKTSSFTEDSTTPKITSSIDYFNLDLPKEFRNKGLETLTEMPKGLIDHAKNWIRPVNWRNLYLYGRWGSGKTSFACALFTDLLKSIDGYHEIPRYIYSRDLDQRLLLASRSGYDLEEIEKWTRPMFLIIDDLDKISPRAGVKAQLFDLMKKRMEKNFFTVITSNCSPDEISEILDGALVSRMTDETKWTLIQFPDRDLRIEQARLKPLKF